MSFLSTAIEEIRSDWPLRIFGLLFCATFPLTFDFWEYADYYRFMGSDVPPVCWPGMDFCAIFRLLDSVGTKYLAQFFGFLAIPIGLCFLYDRTVAIGFLGALGLYLAKALLMAQDARMAMNTQTVIAIVGFAFFFLPDRKTSVKFALVMVYFLSGTTKLNEYWFSGIATQRVADVLSFIPHGLMLYYVVVLELLVAWLLLARNRVIAFFAVAQFYVFQAVSIIDIRWYFPLVMFGLLSIVLLDAVFPKPWKKEEPEFRDWLKKPMVIAFALVLVLLQASPHLLAEDPIRNGRAKLWTLHMFTTKTRCKAEIIPKDNAVRAGAPIAYDMYYDAGGRLACHPLGFYWQAKAICHSGFIGDKPVIDFDLRVEVRRIDEETLTPLIDVKDFCTAGLSYNAVQKNPWVLIP